MDVVVCVCECVCVRVLGRTNLTDGPHSELGEICTDRSSVDITVQAVGQPAENKLHSSITQDWPMT